MKKEEYPALTRAVKIALIHALERNYIDDEGRKILNEFINPGGEILVEVIDSRIQIDGLTQAEFEMAVANIRREQFGGETKK